MSLSLSIHWKMILNKLSLGPLLVMKEATCKQNCFYLLSDLLMRHGLVEFYYEKNGEEMCFKIILSAVFFLRVTLLCINCSFIGATSAFNVSDSRL